MDVVIHGTNTYAANEFMLIVEKEKNIQGMAFDLSMTRDKKIVIFTPTPNSIVTKESLQDSTFEQLKTYRIYTLEDALHYFDGYKNKIILNVMPLNHPPMTEDTLAGITNLNKEYIEEICRVVENHPNLNIYLTSISRTLVSYMKEKIKKNKLGFSIGYDNSYIDVDFYVFSPGFLNAEIMKQQIDNGKEIMLSVRDCEDINLLYRFFFGIERYSIRNEILNALTFISDYPIILLTVLERNT